MSGRRPEVQDPPKQRRLGTLAGWAARLLVGTLRVETVSYGPGTESSHPRIVCFWHNRIIGALAATRKMSRIKKILVLTSASRDGAALAAAMRVFSIGAVRGSSSRRGAAALVALKKALAEGQTVCITPDGPRGPAYHLQPGLVKLASISGKPVSLLDIQFSSYWELKSWDRFRIPKPFSKVILTFQEEIRVPADLNEDSLEEYRKRMEHRLREGFNGRDEDRD
ncbi:MAG: lysophospholipid acyltransferase family protein [Verrucomicrobiota bacterium JB023]|nr:lysophospholipid acyltransferase family protein [Verrucomicrobiota bacterium JB023]